MSTQDNSLKLNVIINRKKNQKDPIQPNPSMFGWFKKSATDFHVIN